MATGQASAQVELLTAEVRVLMVGSRQVTMSVAKQLDRVGLDEIEAFGRIRLHDGEPLVIGRDVRNETLVVARYNEDYPELYRIDCHKLPRGLTVCAAWDTEHTYGERARHAIELEGIAFEVVGATLCRMHGRERQEYHYDTQGYQKLGGQEGECASWDSHGQDARIEKQLKEHQAAFDRHMAACRLPLIVLAGLR